jgi:hypothetical protein
MPTCLLAALLTCLLASPAAITTLNFLGAVPNELEAVFRRGGQWEAGLELMLALAVQVGRLCHMLSCLLLPAAGRFRRAL